MSKPQINDAARKEIRRFFSQLTLMFIGFLLGIALFMVTVLIMAEAGDPKSHSLDTILLLTAPLSSMALLLISNRLFKGRIKQAMDAPKLFQKMDAYRSATMLRFILLDGAAFLQLGAFILTENRLFLLVAVVVATLFMLYRPHLERFIKEMELSEVEANVMRDHARLQG